MKTCTIEKDRWKSFFDEFSRLHRGQRVMVESQMKDYGVQSNVRNLPLQGAVVESKGERGMEIELIAGEKPDAAVTHVIANPIKISVAEWNDSVSAALRIESDDGTVTLVEAGPQAETLAPGYVLDDIDLKTKK